MTKVIFAEWPISGFEYDANFGAYTPGEVAPAAFVLIENEKYRVVWNGDEFDCVAFSWAWNGIKMISIGNGTLQGLSGNNEPFFINYCAAIPELFVYENSQIFSDTAGTHTVAIYQVVSSNDVVILNYSQEPIAYRGVPKVWLTHPRSTKEDPILVPFTYGEAVSKTVVPDFSGGDMSVEMAEGELVTELKIARPTDLTPANIPEGRYIAGVGPGEFKGSGGGSDDTVDVNKPIRFYDPYGEVIYSYTKAEIQELTELPPGPVLSPLTFGGWSHTLDQLKETPYWANVAPWYQQDGYPVSAFILDIQPLDLTTSISLVIQNSSYQVLVNWGDGSTSTLVGNSSTNSMERTSSHTYSTPGKKIVTTRVSSSGGSYAVGNSGYGSSRHPLFYEGNIYQYTPSSSTKYVTIMDRHLISALLYTPQCDDISLLAGCMRLQFVGYGPTVVNPGWFPYVDTSSYAFLDCPNLRTIAGSWPLRAYYDMAFYGTTALERIWNYDGIAANSLDLSDNLKEVIYSGALGACDQLNVQWSMLMIPTTPPAISSASPQWGTNPIYVPDEAVETYKAAAGWSTVADYILPASQYTGLEN